MTEKNFPDVSKSTLKLAIDEIKDYNLYTMPPFKNSAEIRDYLGNHIQDTANEDYSEISEKIKNGEDRETVLEEYVSDDAFDKWYETFCNDMTGIIEK